MDASDISASRIVNEESFHSFDPDRVAEVSADRRNVTLHGEGKGLGRYRHRSHRRRLCEVMEFTEQETREALVQV